MGIVRLLVYTNIWVALAAPSALWFTSTLLGLQTEYPIYFFVFFATLFTYNIQRLYKAGKYYAFSEQFRHRWVIRHEKPLYILTLLSGTTLFFLLFFVPFSYLLWLAPAGLVSAMYFIPFFGTGASKKRLRDTPFLKIFLVAFVWSWVSVAAIGITAGKPVVEWVHLTLFQFFFCFALTIPFDIRDARFDAREGLKTFVSQWGVGCAKIFAVACFLLALAALFFSSVSGMQFLILAVYIFIAAICVGIASSQSHELYYGFWLDGIFLLQGPLVYLAVYI